MSPRPRTIMQITRRGNSIVLVSALLVMLVIIAAAYVTRTNAGRVTARAVQSAESRDSNAAVVAEMLAQIPADALFVKPVDPNYRDPNNPIDANAPRLSAKAAQLLYGVPLHRYNVDLNQNGSDYNGDTFVDASLPYNFVPYWDVPYTNWPDELTIVNTYGLNAANWPSGAGNPSGSNTEAFVHEGNPIGNPGFGDNRWMRDPEPIRVDSRDIGELDAFSHWRHLTYLAMPDNQWRVCRDISDITDFNGDGIGGVVEDLNIPIEQWLCDPSDVVDIYLSNVAPTGTISSNSLYIPSVTDTTHFGRWLTWTGINPQDGSYIGLAGYQSLLTGFSGVGDGSNAPANLYRLGDLEADINRNNYFIGGVHQDRPESEFIFNTARNEVNRFLADTDGDGYTDAFWHLVPLPIKDGIRTVAAVSIIPNNAMINVNTSTRFQPADNITYLQGGNPGIASRTRGHTAADIALFSQGAGTTNFANWNVGFYDDPLNDGVSDNGQSLFGVVSFDYNVARWLRHADDFGWPAGVLSQVQRLDLWRRVGLDPLSASSVSLYRPFALADDLELRMFAGNNYEWIFSNYEHSVQDNAPGFLRAQQGHAESNELAGQVTNRTLVRDPRHRITMYSAVRNEEMPPWLRYRWFRDVNGDNVIDINDAASLPIPVQLDIDFAINNPGPNVPTPNEVVDRFFEQQRLKLDLREPIYDAFGNFNEPGLGRMTFRERLPIALMHALDDGPRQDTTGGNFEGTTYNGDYSVSNLDSSGVSGTDLEDTRRMVASFTANILAYRDQDSNIYLSDVPDIPSDQNTWGLQGPVSLAEVSLDNDPADVNHRFIGMEAQPFLVEGFIGHIYKALLIPDTDFQGHEYINAGNHVVLHDSDRQTTIVVVQIANPYDEPIDLRNYKLSVFDQEFDMATMTGNTILMPASAENPNTAIFYSVAEDLEGDLVRQAWMDFLDIEPGDLTAQTIVQRVPTGVWSDDRDEYATRAADTSIHAIELKRVVENPVGSGTFQDVVIDRIERGEAPNSSDTSREFAEAIDDLENSRPPDQLASPADMYDVVPAGEFYQAPQWDIGPTYTYWVQWVRVTRAWGVDLDANGTYEQDERSPRFIIGDATFHSAQISNDPDVNYPADDRYFMEGNRFVFADDPDDNGDYTGTPTRPVPWFWREYYPIGSPDVTTRKPTFFDMNQGDTNDFPDKGWYSQGSAGVRPDLVDESTIDTNGDIDVKHDFSLQMTQKNGDFEQIGELLNVWIWGHEVEMSNCIPGPCNYEETLWTFSEHMSRDLEELPDVPFYKTRVNRLTTGEETLGYDPAPTDPYLDPLLAVPNQPAGFRVLDMFVCDSWGRNLPGDIDLDGTANTALDFERARFANANGFTGLPVHGLINVSVAPVEVMRGIPNWSRLVYESQSTSQLGRTSRSMVPEAIVQYRERYNQDLGNPYVLRGKPNGIPNPSNPIANSPPSYSNRNAVFSAIDEMREERGFATIGELMMLQEPAVATDADDTNRWSIDFAGLNPFEDYQGTPFLHRLSARLSTDVVDDRRNDVTGFNPGQYWDDVASDAEERNMLFAGASNMVTTRTDTFTIYFRLRSFKQNPVSGRWDATDPEYIVDDSRYVMLVDRSNVNQPGDKPKILYFEKLPN